MPSRKQGKGKPGVMSHMQRNVFGTQQIYIGFDFEVKANEVGGVLSGTEENKKYKM
jgi:hypothetical protein